MNYTFDKIESDNMTLSLKVHFKKPSAISADISELDILDIIVKEQKLFVSADTK